MTSATPLVATLVLTGGAADQSELGGKGAALDRLIGWGFRVPETGVVTANAYRSFVEQAPAADLVERLLGGDDVEADEIDRTFAATPVPDVLREEIADLGRRVGAGHRVAVRSSATAEDLSASSFAGLYRSVLDVDPDRGDALIEAVVSVFASLWHPAPRAYRRTLGIDETDVAMAVVVMRMVDATRAGVVFTIDHTDPRRRARVEAVDGLAESLVSGRRTPEAWLLDPGDDDVDAPAEIVAALRAACDIATSSGHSQDVEWAWADHELWIVQARPITTVGADEDGDGFDSASGDGDLTTAGIGEMLPGVLPPLLWGINAHLVEEAFRSVLERLGLPVDEEGGALLHRVHGRVALDFSRLRDMATLLPGGAADELEQQYFGSRRTGRPSAPASPRGGRLSAARHDLRVLTQQHRAIQDGELVLVAMAEIREKRPELDTLSTPQLLRYRFRLVDLAARSMAAELTIAAAAAAAYRRLELTLASSFGEAEGGRLAGSVTAGAGIVTAANVDASARLFGGPTWRELGRTMKVPDRGTAPDDIEERVRRSSDPDSPLGWWRSRRLARAIDATIDQLRRREATKAGVLEMGGEVRRVHLELGRRLVDAGTLRAPTDIDLLGESELGSAIRGDGPTLNALAKRRRWIERYESEGPLPFRFSGRPERSAPTLPAGARLEGWAASGGRCTALARFADHPDVTIERGSVLLAEATDSSWAPYFIDAAGVVLERGGPLSHAAILARELGVPAVLNVGPGLRSLDGRVVTVDGDTGIVVVREDIPPEDEPEPSGRG